MGLFSKKKPEDKPAFKRKMAERVCNAKLRYVTEWIDGKENVICHGGMANIRDNVLIISAQDKDIFRCKINDMKASNLMSLDGTIIEANDLAHDNKYRKITVFYVYYRD